MTTNLYSVALKALVEIQHNLNIVVLADRMANLPSQYGISLVTIVLVPMTRASLPALSGLFG